ncbi:Golgin subfamily A member 7/ERF4 family-domain-containing protein [Boletus reticuloceps]|uniref:Ras modification protein ERF4 n=1 Tax=Boletus reticuloceps TaxID=495285 RepID=A0A8I3A6H0_9AGAM|nr:Golgin subfamily A member 7/ERF4 family-domain-containing protein [Boletus reticuloceps]
METFGLVRIQVGWLVALLFHPCSYETPIRSRSSALHISCTRTVRDSFLLRFVHSIQKHSSYASRAVMTSLEHVPVKHALDRSPSWTRDGHGHVAVAVAEVRDKVEVEVEEVEEVHVGVAVTTVDDVGVGIAVDRGSIRAENESERQVGSANANANGDANATATANAHGNGNGNEQQDQEVDESGRCGLVTARRLSRSMSPLRCASHSRSRSRSLSLSESHSRSHSHSLTHSRSHSRFSVRGPLEMNSSVATSWMQVDVEGVGVGRLGGPDGGDPCRLSVGRSELEQDSVDVGTGEEAKPPGDDTEVVSLSRFLIKDNKDRGDLSHKEEVLVVQEEDIGESWHPLRHDSKVQSQVDGEGEKGVVEEDVGSVHAGGSAHGADRSLEMDEKGRRRTFGSSGRNARHLRLEFKSPSPQPWDEVDPPTDNNETYTSDYYSTLNSKKFETMQKCRQRPLIPHSSYYFGPPPSDAAYGTAPVGQIGVHHPREIVRIERDYAGGELTQFSPIFPLELEGRITPTQFHQTINNINEILISAHSIRHGFIDNCLAVITLQLSVLFVTSHYTKQLRRLKKKIEELNTQLYNPVGLNILWPQKVAFLFLEIEYY